jgi:hypothetical protein
MHTPICGADLLHPLPSDGTIDSSRNISINTNGISTPFRRQGSAGWTNPAVPARGIIDESHIIACPGTGKGWMWRLDVFALLPIMPKLASG